MGVAEIRVFAGVLMTDKGMVLFGVYIAGPLLS